MVALDRVASSLNVRLPRSACEWYGDPYGLQVLQERSNADWAVPPNEWRARGTGDARAIVFLHENQGVYQWGWADDGTEDPPVWVEEVRYDLPDPDAADPAWEPVGVSFSDFVHCRVWDFAPSRFGLCCRGGEVTDPLLGELARWLPSGPVTKDGFMFSGVRLHRFGWRGPRVSVGRHDGDSIWWLAADERDDFETLANVLLDAIDLVPQPPSSESKELFVQVRQRTSRPVP